MSRRWLSLGLFAASLAVPTGVRGQEAMSQLEIDRAVLPLPDVERASATVMIVEDDEARTVHEGEGAFICIADTPGDDRFHASCYHKTLEPYMTRGRELRAGGMTQRESIEKRAEEISDGILEMPEYGMLHQLFAGGDSDDEVASAQHLTVIYVPFATSENLGLPTGRSSGPWMMFSGLGTAHIMISG